MPTGGAIFQVEFADREEGASMEPRERLSSITDTCWIGSCPETGCSLLKERDRSGSEGGFVVVVVCAEDDPATLFGERDEERFCEGAGDVELLGGLAVREN